MLESVLGLAQNYLRASRGAHKMKHLISYIAYIYMFRTYYPYHKQRIPPGLPTETNGQQHQLQRPLEGVTPIANSK